MHYQILKEPMSMLEIQLNNEEEVTGEAGAMVYIKGNIEVKTATRSGGGFKKFKVTALGGQSFFVNNYIPMRIIVSLV
jgi:uncharacterized protein (AIM24 family)